MLRFFRCFHGALPRHVSKTPMAPARSSAVVAHHGNGLWIGCSFTWQGHRTEPRATPRKGRCVRGQVHVVLSSKEPRYIDPADRSHCIPVFRNLCIDSHVRFSRFGAFRVLRGGMG